MNAVNSIEAVKKFETNASHIVLRSDGIVKISMKNDAEVDIAESRKIFEIVSSFATKKELLVLVIAAKGGNITKEARDFAGSDEASSVTIAEAIVTASLAHRLLVNFLLNFYKPKREIKLFNNEDDALIWLNGFN